MKKKMQSNLISKSVVLNQKCCTQRAIPRLRSYKDVVAIKLHNSMTTVWEVKILSFIS